MLINWAPARATEDNAMDRWTFGTFFASPAPRVAAATAAALVVSSLVASPGAAQRGGWEEGRDRGRGPDLVVLYSEPGFRGRSEAFRRDDGRLGDNRIGNDAASSIEVPWGCRVTLYEHDDFRGRSVELDRSVADLGRTRVGNRRASSLRVSCGRPGGGDGDLRDGGVVLYEDEDYRGRSEFFEGDVADLRRTRIGSDRVSSIRVARDCRVTLFRDVDFRGRSADFDRDHPDLGRTPLGNDAASSLAVDCRGGDWDDGGWGDRGGVTLYSEPYFRGERLGVDRDERSLGRTRIGNDRVRSVRVSRGCQATLYEDDDYRGRSVDLDRDAPSLEGAPVRPGEASSNR
ncbi:MAG: beta/gamma crystallin-related protein, partial [Acidobacteriota bacterium]